MTLPPAFSRKDLLLGCLSIAASTAVLGLFLLCCWSAAADAQGAVAFVFAAPIFGVGLLVSLLLAWSARRWLGGRLGLAAAAVLSAFIALFYGAGFVPGLRSFPNAVIRRVADGYKTLTGKTPFQADKGL